MRIAARLARLERHPGAGCPVCRDRRVYTVLHVIREEADGTTHSVTEAPQPCGHCGEMREGLVEIIEVIVSTRRDLAEWPARQRADPD
jgi:hypothetical protein